MSAFETVSDAYANIWSLALCHSKLALLISRVACMNPCISKLSESGDMGFWQATLETGTFSP